MTATARDTHKLPGAFLVFEGGDGSGKSTQARLAGEALAARGHEVVLTRDPGGSPSASEIRKLLLEGDVDRWDPKTEVLLFTAARVELIERTVLPNLARGAIVISDRFLDSTLAYQGGGHGNDVGNILELHRRLCGDLRPDLTVLLDGPVETLLARSKARLAGEASTEDRYEQMALDFHKRLAEAYRAQARNDPGRYLVADATAGQDAVTANVLAELLPRVDRLFDTPAVA